LHIIAPDPAADRGRAREGTRMSHDHRSKTHSASSQPRPPRRIHEEVSGKLPELAVCPRCAASYRNGRWTWTPAPVGSYEHVCPACERIETKHYAGVLHVGGTFAREHRDEILGLIRNLEERERGQHPLERIAAIEDEPDGFRVATTGQHLVVGLGRALERAYDGRLEQAATTAEQDDLARVHWWRD